MNNTSSSVDIDKSQNIDWHRVRHLLKLGIVAANIVLAGDMILGWGVSDPSVTELPSMFTRYLTVSDGRIFASAILGLIGIPPTGGFISKWYIASGALELSSAFAFIGPVVLLISAILTAAYLLTITIQGFFPGKDFDTSELTPVTSTVLMWGPMLLLTLLVVIGGMFPDRLISYFSVIASSLI